LKGTFVTELKPTTPSSTQQELLEIDLTLPRFEGEEYRQLSLPESRREPFIVDLTSYTCECPEWSAVRSQFPENDVRRVCKHIAGILTEEPYTASLTGLARIWCADSIESDEGIPVFGVLKAYNVDGVCVVLARAVGLNSVDVLGYPGYVRRERPYSIFAYDLLAREWSYGQAPANGLEIEELIQHSFEAEGEVSVDPHTAPNSAVTSAPNHGNVTAGGITRTWLWFLLVVIALVVIGFAILLASRFG
jgi:hypothetical protein